jgi:hypothetical protein
LSLKIDFLEEPELEFGAGRHIDIRFGLRNYGPLDFESPTAPRAIPVAIIGTPETVEGLAEWLHRCDSGIPAKPSHKHNLFTSFPGFRDDNTLNTKIIQDATLQRTIPSDRFAKLKAFGGSPVGVQQAVDLFMAEIAAISEKVAAKVILCALPLSLLKNQGTAAGVAEETPEDSSRTLDFHHLLKAKAMSVGLPIQLVLPMTYDETKRLPQKLKTFRLRTSQDEATRAWNLHVALYYKAGGAPWRLPRHPTELAACHVGISFYESLDRTALLTSVAQVFNERGEGTIVRGGAARISKEDRQPHLDAVGANTILRNALSAYRSEHHNLPARVALHKSSSYSREEIEGFKGACQELAIDSVDLIALHDSSTRLFRNGLYPALRGTWLTLDVTHHVLYTRGSVDFFETYPGMYAPQTLGITLDSVEQAPRFLCHEILALTKMNWNNTQFDGFDPITLRAARRVGKILKYVPMGDKIQPRYSFYM